MSLLKSIGTMSLRLFKMKEEIRFIRKVWNVPKLKQGFKEIVEENKMNENKKLGRRKIKE